MVTRRTTQRQFLFRPDDETNNAFVYCLAEAAELFEIDVIASEMMSNHHHTVVYDPRGNIIEFMARFHKHLAKCQNALRGRWENCFSSEQPCLVELIELTDVTDKVVYTCANPVLSHLVERATQWPGPKTVPAMLSRVPLVATRPKYFSRKGGEMPDTVTLVFAIPEVLGDPKAFLDSVRERIKAVEVEMANERATTGRRIVGRAAVLRQSWRSSPATYVPRRGLRPTVAARSKWARIAALQRNAEFLSAYQFARKAWLMKKPVPFPVGTYWMARFVGVPVVEQAVSN